MIYTIFIIPLLIVLIGYLMNKYPSKKINYFIGYRTFNSMKNENNWKLANQYCGKLWFKIGLIMLIISILLFIFNLLKIITFTENMLSIIVLIQIIPLLISIFFIENKIKKL